jgi:hypothetical protein
VRSQDRERKPRATGTHQLSSGDDRSRQDSKIKQARGGGHSRTVGRDTSAQRNSATKQGSLTLCRAYRATHQVSERKRRARGACSLSSAMEEINQNSERIPWNWGETHVLSRAEQGTRQDSKRKLPSQKHSPSAKRRVMDSSGQQKNDSQRGAPTNCQTKRERQVRTTK